VTQINDAARRARNEREGESAVKTTRAEPARFRRVVGRLLATTFIGLGAVVVSVAGFTGPGGAVRSGDAGSTCPGGVSQCVTATIPANCAGTCPTVTVGPTDKIGEGQYVYLNMTNFPAGGLIRIAFCPVDQNYDIVPHPDCGFGVAFDGVSYNPSVLPVGSTGSVQGSYPTDEEASGNGNAPFLAEPVGAPAVKPQPTFYCDNGPDLCAIEVQNIADDNEDDAMTTSNTAVIPITYVAATNGCPSSAPQIFTDSAFSLEHFLPAAVDSTCRGPSGVSAVNTATNTQEGIQDLAAGGVHVDFTDTPQDPGEKSTLASSGGSYSYIPVAVSATVIGFLVGDTIGNADVPTAPVGTYDMTPNMIAGLISTEYSAGYDSDLLVPPLNCSQLWHCDTPKLQPNYTAANYDTFDYLNPVPSDELPPITFGMFFSNAYTGASYQVTNWLCDAPNPPITITVNENGTLVNPKKPKLGYNPKPTQVTVTDANTASQTLTVAPVSGIAWPPANDPTAPWPYKTCTPYPQLPVLAAGNNQYEFGETPALQAHYLRGYAYGGGSQPGTRALAGFGALDWSEASYYGLNSASLQNAAGQFVSPSETSIDDALNDTTESSDGIVSYNYNDSSDSGAYPMPLVTYAVVSTSGLSPENAQAEGDLLTNMVCYSHFGGTITMPDGYVPLTDNLYDQARTEISKLFPNAEKTCNGTHVNLATGSSGTKSGKNGRGSGSRSHGTNGANAFGTDVLLAHDNGAFAAGYLANGSNRYGSGRGGRGSGSSYRIGPGYEPEIVALATGAERWILPVLIGVGLFGIVAGPLLASAPSIRRRLQLRKKPS